MKVSVIIPAYNEAATLPLCLSNIYGKNPDLDLEIILVDDGSSDSTPEIARNFSRQRFTYIRQPVNRGKGAAIRTGLAAVTGDVVLIQDADMELDPVDYFRLLLPIQEGARVVYGSRVLKKDNAWPSRLFYWGGRAVSAWTNFLYGSRLTDEPCGYKVFRTEILKSLDLQCQGFEFCPEVTAKILKRGIPIQEVPVSYRPRFADEGKKIYWKDGIAALWVLLKHRFRA